MQYSEPIGTMSAVLNGTTMCVAARRELWVSPKEGDAFAVHSIVDEGGADSPFYMVYVTDYRGNRYAFETLARESQEELLDFAITEQYEREEEEMFLYYEDWYERYGDDYESTYTPSKRERAMSDVQRKYLACIYGYTLEPLPWQRDYEWRDYVADSDFSIRLGIEDADGPIASETFARECYRVYREDIERYGLEDFYLSNFGYLYRSDAA